MRSFDHLQVLQPKRLSISDITLKQSVLSEHLSFEQAVFWLLHFWDESAVIQLVPFLQLRPNHPAVGSTAADIHSVSAAAADMIFLFNIYIPPKIFIGLRRN